MFTDDIRRMAEGTDTRTMVAPSQGIHLVFDRSFLHGDTAIMVPHTSDGRVLFAIPWHDHLVCGTTDTPIESPSYEPLPFEAEIEFVLETAAQYLSRPPKREDILSIYVGIRPLVKPGGGEDGKSPSAKTSSLSRDHTIHIDNSGLLTIVGGKWTTYRHMAEDTVDHAITLGKLEDKPCATRDLKIHGYYPDALEVLGELAVYGSDAEHIEALAEERPEWAERLHPDLPYIAAEIVWGVRQEMSRTVDDALSRRTRALLLNAAAASAMAPEVAALLAAELGRDQGWIDRQVAEFQKLAAQYLPSGVAQAAAHV
jgi:glycerol-3-phosphate dehydrogenase